MKGNGIFAAVSIVLCIIIGVLFYMIYAQSAERGFTELYFDSSAKSSYDAANGDVNFSFVIANHESRDMIYHYSVMVDYGMDKDEILSEDVSVRDGDAFRMPVRFAADPIMKSVKVSVAVHKYTDDPMDEVQEIHFWVKKDDN